MAEKEVNEAMLTGITAKMQKQAEENQAQMRELLKTSQEMMAQAEAPLTRAMRTVKTTTLLNPPEWAINTMTENKERDDLKQWVNTK